MANPSAPDTQTVTYNNQPNQAQPRHSGRDDNSSTYAQYLKEQKKLGLKEAELLSKEEWLMHKRIKIANLEQQLIERETKEANTKRTNGQKQFRSIDHLLAKMEQNQKQEQLLKKKFIPDLALQYQKVQKDVLSKVGQVKYAAMNTPIQSGVAKPLTKGVNLTGELLGLSPALMSSLKLITKPMELVAKGLDKGISKGTNKIAEMRHDDKTAKALAKNSDEFKGNEYAALNYVKQRRQDMKDLVELQNKQGTMKELGVASTELDEKIEKILTRLAPPEKKEEKKETVQEERTQLAPPTPKETGTKSAQTNQSPASSAKLIQTVKFADTAARKNANVTNKTLRMIAAKLTASENAAKKVQPAPASPTPSATPTTGTGMFDSFLKPIMDMIEGFKSFGSIASGIAKNVFGLAKGFIRFAGPIGLAAALIMSLDFEKDLFAPISKIIKSFTDGSWLEGIGRIFTFIPQTIGKAFMRLGAWIADLFGFEDVAKALTEFADNFDIVDMLKNLWATITEGIGKTLTGMMKSIAGFTMIVPAVVPDFLLQKIGMPREIKPFEGLGVSSNVSAPASPPSTNVGTNIVKSSVEVSDGKSAQPVVIAPQTTTTNVVNSSSTTAAIGMRPRPRYKDESIMRHNRESWSTAGGYSI